MKKYLTLLLESFVFACILALITIPLFLFAWVIVLFWLVGLPMMYAKNADKSSKYKVLNYPKIEFVIFWLLSGILYVPLMMLAGVALMDFASR